ncbi:hypothetical protein QTP88_023825 [Uroleucon formosanum]
MSNSCLPPCRTLVHLDFELHCAIPRCISNTFVEEVGDIVFYTPPRECVKEWSQALGLQLTVNSIVCERHFKPEDMVYPELIINGSKVILKTLVKSALPISINTTQSVSYVSKYVPVQGPIGDIVNSKVKNVSQKNSGLADIKAIKSILTGQKLVDLSHSDIVNM